MPAPSRLAFLYKGTHAFLLILRTEEQGEKTVLIIEAAFERHFLSFQDSLFCHAD